MTASATPENYTTLTDVTRHTDNAAQQIEDAGERRRSLAAASRETRYFADRPRTAQVVPPPVEFGTVVFGHNVTFKRDDGRRQAFRIVGEWINSLRLPRRVGSDR
jgi:transcription elongation GreA/GreB family factor